MPGLSKNWLIYMGSWPAQEKIAKQIPKSLLSVQLGGICLSPMPEGAHRKLTANQHVPDKGRAQGSGSYTANMKPSITDETHSPQSHKAYRLPRLTTPRLLHILHTDESRMLEQTKSKTTKVKLNH